MRRLLTFALLTTMAICSLATAQQRPLPLRPPPPGAMRMDPMAGVQRYSYVFPATGERLEYAVFVSSRVSKKKPGPLVIALHGLGGQPGMMIGLLREQAERHGYIVFAPMGYNPRGGYGAFPNGIGGPPDSQLSEFSEQDVMNVLKLALAQFNIDMRRIYLLGHSMGGGGALHLGIKYSGIWAAVGATAPAPGSLMPSDLEKARQLPFILVHGDADPAVPVAVSRNWAAKLEELGMTYQYRELRAAGHEDAILQGARLVFDFFDKHRRPAEAAIQGPGAGPPGLE